MRQILLMVILCLLLGQVACSKKKSSVGEANANVSPEPMNATEEHRSQARLSLGKGKELYRTDRDEEAAAAFEDAIKLDPDHAEGYFRLGLAYDALGKPKEAEDSYRKGVERYKKYLEDNSKDAEAHYNLGQCYAGLHLYLEAAKEYRQATHLKPDDTDIYFDLGVALSRLAQYDEAVAAFSKSIEIDPENYRAQDALDEAQEGVKRIRAGKKHQEELLKKQKDEELKKQAEGTTPESAAKPADPKKP